MPGSTCTKHLELDLFLPWQLVVSPAKRAVDEVQALLPFRAALTNFLQLHFLFIWSWRENIYCIKYFMGTSQGCNRWGCAVHSPQQVTINFKEALLCSHIRLILSFIIWNPMKFLPFYVIISTVNVLVLKALLLRLHSRRGVETFKELEILLLQGYFISQGTGIALRSF